MKRPLRYWIKRRLFIRNLQRICDAKGFRIAFHRDPMELRDGNDDARDFSVYTDDTVFSVKLIPANQRNAVLQCHYKGVYCIADGTTLPQSTYLHNKRMQFIRPTPVHRMPKAKGTVPDGEGKKIRNIFLVHPTCYKYVCIHPVRTVQTITSGDTFLGWELWCGRDFRKLLKSL